MKRIVVWNLKGGQGKTVLSLSIAMLEGAFIVTNDVHSPIDKVLGESRALRLKVSDPLPTVPSEVELIYDFGGFADVRVIEAVKDAEFVVMPIIFESDLEMEVLVNAINEIKQFNNNIVIVVNKAEKGDLERTKEVLDSFDFKYPIFEIKKSTAFPRAVKFKKSLQQMVDEKPLLKYHYSKPLAQLQELIKHIS